MWRKIRNILVNCFNRVIIIHCPPKAFWVTKVLATNLDISRVQGRATHWGQPNISPTVLSLFLTIVRYFWWVEIQISHNSLGHPYIIHWNLLEFSLIGPHLNHFNYKNKSDFSPTCSLLDIRRPPCYWLSAFSSLNILPFSIVFSFSPNKYLFIRLRKPLYRKRSLDEWPVIFHSFNKAGEHPLCARLYARY